MKRFLALVGALQIGLGVLLVGSSQAGNDGPLSGATVVLVHGAYANSSSWAKVIPMLENRGLRVVAVHSPLSSLADDVAATRRAMELQKGPIVLVGHSWGGAVITQAGDDPKVKALVYVSAVAPDAGQSVADLTKGLPEPSWGKTVIKDSGDFLWLPTKTVISDFAQDLPYAEARMIATTQGPWAARCTEDKLTVSAWRLKPSWWVLPAFDHMVPPSLQEKSAMAMNSKIVRVSSSHVAMLKKPREVADTIISAVVSTIGTGEGKATGQAPTSITAR